MQHPRWVIPRQPHVPLHVRVEREAIARRVEVDAERIAQPARDHFPRRALAIRANEMAVGHRGAGVEQMFVPRARQQPILRVVPQRRTRRHAIRRQTHVVAVNAVDETIRPKRKLVAPVPDIPRRVAQHFEIVELVVAIRVAQPHQRLRVVRVCVERVVSEEQPAAFEQIGVDGLDARDRRAIRRQRHPQQPAILARDDDAPLRVKGHRHPRAFIRLRRAEEFHLEAGPGGDVFHARGAVRPERLLPLVVIFFEQGLRGEAVRHSQGQAECDDGDADSRRFFRGPCVHGWRWVCRINSPST